MRGRPTRWNLAALTLLVALLVAGPARADTAIYYSAPENAYGWCAGFSYNKAHSCARGYCEQSGSDCGVADECDGGWGAVALAQDPARGFAAICGTADAMGARMWALAHCVAETNTLCWTDSTFDGGGDAAARASDGDFDLAWYTQAMLQIRNYDPGQVDGRMGPQTQDAIRKFQADVGLPQTGAADEQLVRQLLYAVGGAGRLAEIIRRDVVEARGEQRLGYFAAPRPVAKQSFGQWMLSMPKPERLEAIATMLSASDTPCTRPALDVSPLPDETSGVWNIACAEGNFTLMMSEDGSRLIMKGSSEMAPEGEGRTGGRKTNP